MATLRRDKPTLARYGELHEFASCMISPNSRVQLPAANCGQKVNLVSGRNGLVDSQRTGATIDHDRQTRCESSITTQPIGGPGKLLF